MKSKFFLSHLFLPVLLTAFSSHADEALTLNPLAGLWQVRFENARADWTRDILSVEEGADWRTQRRRELGPITAYATTSESSAYTSEIWGDAVLWPNVDRGQFAYGGYVYLDASKTYRFRAKIDDDVYLAIVDFATGATNVLFNSVVTYVPALTSDDYSPSATGWHRLEIRFSDNTGGRGAADGAGNYKNTVNLGFSDDGGHSWKMFRDPGDGSLLRTEIDWSISVESALSDSRWLMASLRRRADHAPSGDLYVLWDKESHDEAFDLWPEANVAKVGTWRGGEPSFSVKLPRLPEEVHFLRFVFVGTDLPNRPVWSCAVEVGEPVTGKDPVLLAARVTAISAATATFEVAVGLPGEGANSGELLAVYESERNGVSEAVTNTVAAGEGLLGLHALTVSTLRFGTDYRAYFIMTNDVGGFVRYPAAGEELAFSTKKAEDEDCVFSKSVAGLWQVRFENARADWSRDILAVAEGSDWRTQRRHELGPIAAYATTSRSYRSDVWGDAVTWPNVNYGQFAYLGYIHLDAEKSYRFRAKIDDDVYLAITDAGTGEKTEIFNSVTTTVPNLLSDAFAPSATGWHRLEIRFSDNTGGRGAGLSADRDTENFGFSEDGGASWKKLIDPGDGSLLTLFRIEDLRFSVAGVVDDGEHCQVVLERDLTRFDGEAQVCVVSDISYHAGDLESWPEECRVAHDVWPTGESRLFIKIDKSSPDVAYLRLAVAPRDSPNGAVVLSEPIYLPDHRSDLAPVIFDAYVGSTSEASADFSVTALAQGAGANYGELFVVCENERGDVIEAVTNSVAIGAECLGIHALTVATLRFGTDYRAYFVLTNDVGGVVRYPAVGDELVFRTKKAEDADCFRSRCVSGLWQMRFTNSDANWTRDIHSVPVGSDWQTQCRRELGPVMAYTRKDPNSRQNIAYRSDVWNDDICWSNAYEQWAYVGYVWLSADKVYRFRMAIDDNEYLKITDPLTGESVVLINDTGRSKQVQTSASYRPAHTGRYQIELRMSDDITYAGGCVSTDGYVNSSNAGYSDDDGATWMLLRDSGDGSLFSLLPQGELRFSVVSVSDEGLSCHAVLERDLAEFDGDAEVYAVSDVAYHAGDVGSWPDAGRVSLGVWPAGASRFFAKFDKLALDVAYLRLAVRPVVCGFRERDEILSEPIYLPDHRPSRSPVILDASVGAISAASADFSVAVLTLGAGANYGELFLVYEYERNGVSEVVTNSIATGAECLGIHAPPVATLRFGTDYRAYFVLTNDVGEILRYPAAGDELTFATKKAEDEDCFGSRCVAGLWQMRFTNSDANWTRDIHSVPVGSDWQTQCRRELGPVMAYTRKDPYSQQNIAYRSDVWNDDVCWSNAYEQWTYVGYVWLSADKVYRFRMAIDDNEYLKITDPLTGESVVLINDTGRSKQVQTSASYRPAHTGRYQIELRMSDDITYAGGCVSTDGYVNSSNAGYSDDDGVTWNLMRDSGDGSLFSLLPQGELRFSVVSVSDEGLSCHAVLERDLAEFDGDAEVYAVSDVAYHAGDVSSWPEAGRVSLGVWPAGASRFFAKFDKLALDVAYLRFAVRPVVCGFREGDEALSEPVYLPDHEATSAPAIPEVSVVATNTASAGFDVAVLSQGKGSRFAELLAVCESELYGIKTAVTNSILSGADITGTHAFRVVALQSDMDYTAYFIVTNDLGQTVRIPEVGDELTFRTWPGDTLCLAKASSGTFRYDDRSNYPGRLVRGTVNVVAADGASAEPWDTTAVADGWNVFPGGDETNKVAVLNDPHVIIEGGRLSENTVWSGPETHLLRNIVYVSSGVTLTVTTNAVVKFCEGTKILIESGAMMRVVGAEGADVVFTAANDNSVGAVIPGLDERDVLSFDGIVLEQSSVSLPYIDNSYVQTRGFSTAFYQTLTLHDAVVNRDCGMAYVEVSVSGTRNQAFSMDWQVTGGEFGKDHMLSSGRLNWANTSEGSKWIEIPVNAERTYERSRKFSVSVTAVRGGNGCGSTATVELREYVEPKVTEPVQQAFGTNEPPIAIGSVPQIAEPPASEEALSATVDEPSPIAWRVTDANSDFAGTYDVSWTNSDGQSASFTGVTEGVFTNLFTSPGEKTVTMRAVGEGGLTAERTWRYWLDPADYRVVTFDIGAFATASGARLVQYVLPGGDAVAPTVTPGRGSIFVGWDVSFSNVQEDLTVHARYERIRAVPELTAFAAAPVGDGRSFRLSATVDCLNAAQTNYLYVTVTDPDGERPVSVANGLAVRDGALTFDWEAERDVRLDYSGDVTLKAYVLNAPLLHRWNFNGNDDDQVTGGKAALCGTGVSLGSEAVTLSGGVRGTSYVDLGTNLIADLDHPVTIELWAKTLSRQNWSRCFDCGTGTADLDYFCLAWSNGTTDKDHVYIGGIGDISGFVALCPFELGRFYHISLTVSPKTTGGWTAIWRKINFETGAVENRYVMDCPAACAFRRMDNKRLYLGHSFYTDDRDANAVYDEVRIWGRDLDDWELSQNALAGPDAPGRVLTATATVSVGRQPEIVSPAERSERVELLLGEDDEVVWEVRDANGVETNGFAVTFADSDGRSETQEGFSGVYTNRFASPGEKVLTMTVHSSGGRTVTRSWRYFVDPAKCRHVIFDVGEHGTTDGATNVWVGAGAGVTPPEVTPLAGWLFDGWDGETDEVNADTTIIAKYRKEPGRLTLTAVETTLREGDAKGVQLTVRRNNETDTDLTVGLSADPEGQLVLPASVTIPSGNAETVVSVTAADNAVAEGGRSVTVTAAADGYGDGVATLTVEDDEVPALAFVTDVVKGREGDTVTVTVTRTGSLVRPLTVYLTGIGASQCAYPSSVTFPAGEASVSFELTATDDEAAEVAAKLSLRASASGYASATWTFELEDDDVPGVSLSIQPESVSEGAGAYACLATLRRTTDKSLDKAVAVVLTADVQGALILPASVTIPANARSTTFVVGTVDDARADGDRTVTVTGAVRIESCGCSGQPSSGEAIRAEVTVVDNDGPALTLAADPMTMREGLDVAGYLTVSHNTTLAEDLVVTLTSGDTRELTLPSTAVLPAGAGTSVRVPVRTVDDGDEDGGKVVTVSVAADGFAPDATWVLVSDANLPNLRAANVSNNVGQVIAGERLNVCFDVVNDGVRARNGAIPYAVYWMKGTSQAFQEGLSEPILSGYLDGSLDVGASRTVCAEVEAPTWTGDGRIAVVVDPEGRIAELNDADNTAWSPVYAISPAFVAEARVSGEARRFLPGATIEIVGSAVETDGVTPAVGETVEIYLVCGGLRQTLEAQTDADGAFSAVFAPLDGEVGHFTLGASYPGIDSSAEQDAFDILGIGRQTDTFVTWDLTVGDSAERTVRLKNLGPVPHTGLVAEAVGLPPSCELDLTFPDPAELAADGTVDLTLRASAVAASPAYEYEPFKVRVTSAEGVSYVFSAWFHSSVPGALLVADPKAIDATMTRGAVRRVAFDVRNLGAGETGPITVSVPPADWLRVAGGRTIPSLTNGASATVTLELSPDAAVELNRPFSGELSVTCAAAPELLVPVTFTAVSESTGSLTVDAVDENTSYLASAPHLAGAKVTVSNPYTGAKVAEGTTGEDGRFSVEGLPEGSYQVVVTAERHGMWANLVAVEPGRTTTVRTFLQYQAIMASWNVRRVGVEDRYEVTLRLDYEAKVPVPIVKFTFIDQLPQLKVGESAAFRAVAENQGFIRAENVTLTPPDLTSWGFYWTYSKEPFDLPAGAARFIPVMLTRRAVQDDDSGGGGGSSGEVPGSETGSGQGDSGPEGEGSGSGSQEGGPEGEGGNSESDWPAGMPCQGVAQLGYSYPCEAEDHDVSVPAVVQIQDNCTPPSLDTAFGIAPWPFIDGTSTPPVAHKRNSNGVSGGSWGNGSINIYKVGCYDITTNDILPCIKSMIKTSLDIGEIAFAYASPSVSAKVKRAKQLYTDATAVVKYAPEMYDKLVEMTHDKHFVSLFVKPLPYLIVTGEINDYRPAVERSVGEMRRLWTETSAQQKVDATLSAVKTINSRLPKKWRNAKLGQGITLYQDWRSFQENCLELINGSRKDLKKTNARAAKALSAAGRHSSSGVTRTDPPDMDGGKLYRAISVVGDELFSVCCIYREFLGASVWMDAEVEQITSFLEACHESFARLNGRVSVEDVLPARPDGVTDGDVRTFVERLNRTMGEDSGEIADLDIMTFYAGRILDDYGYATANGYGCAVEAFIEAFGEWLESFNAQTSDPESDNVCAAVGLKLSQTVALTREAFEGTLSLRNGHLLLPMGNVRLDLRVTDEAGDVRNGLFEISQVAMTGLDGASVLAGDASVAAGGTGTAVIRFVPGVDAAPDGPKLYRFGGSVSYNDPFTGECATIELVPVELTVNPSALLDFDYFVQRDVYADDPFTKDVVEASMPAEIAVLVRNRGLGDAHDVTIHSAQPEKVVDDKGLMSDFRLCDYTLDASALNGATAGLGLNDVNLGTIPAGGVSLAQWWLTSSLQGHFSGMQASVTHLNSLGTADTSLIRNVRVHKLVRSVTLEGEPLPGFLVSDADYYGRPETLHHPSGELYAVRSAAISLVSDKQNDLIRSVTLSARLQKGWNYGCLKLDGLAAYTVEQVTRNGADVPVRNVWITDRTFRDGNDPLDESRLHLFDHLPDEGLAAYVVTLRRKPTGRPRVISFDGVADETIVGARVDVVGVSFSCAVEPDSFTADDLSVRFQGEPADVSALKIAPDPSDAARFTISGLAALAPTEGRTILTVMSAGVQSTDGTLGVSEGRKLAWTWCVDAAPELVRADGLAGASFRLSLTEDERLGAADAIGVVLTRNGSLVKLPAKTKVTMLSEGACQIDGLDEAIAKDGKYVLSVRSAEMSSAVSLEWEQDTTPPEKITDLRISPDRGESAEDGVTCESSVVLTGTLPTDAVTVRVLVRTLAGEETFVRELTPESRQLEVPVELPEIGNQHLVVVCVDASGNASETTLKVFVDGAALTASFAGVPQPEDPADAVRIAFSDDVDVTTLTAARLSLLRDGMPVDCSSVTFTSLEDATVFRLENLADLTAVAGTYRLILDLPHVAKRTSGKTGDAEVVAIWTHVVPDAVPPAVAELLIDGEAPKAEYRGRFSEVKVAFTEPVNLPELKSAGLLSRAFALESQDADGKWIRLAIGDDVTVTATDLVWRVESTRIPYGTLQIRIDAGLVRDTAGNPLASEPGALEGTVPVFSDPAVLATVSAYAMPTFYDINGDGLVDIIVGENASGRGRAQVFVNTGTALAPKFGEPVPLRANGGELSVAASGCQGVSVAFLDFDGDGTDDLIEGRADGRVYFHRATSRGVYGPEELIWPTDKAGAERSDRAVLSVFDVTGDGKEDLVIGGADGRFRVATVRGGHLSATYLKDADGNGWTLADGRSAGAFADWNGDGDPELVVGGTHGGLGLHFMADGACGLESVALVANKYDDSGLYRTRPATCDLNGDGVCDIAYGTADGVVRILYGTLPANPGARFSVIPETAVEAEALTPDECATYCTAEVYNFLETRLGLDLESLTAAELREVMTSHRNGKRLTVYEEFVAGTDPLDETSEFKAQIEIVDGEPVVTWDPDLNEAGRRHVRTYTIFGKDALDDGEPWREVENKGVGDRQFFKVTVELP